MAECQDTYKECVAARRARVEAALASAEPWETEIQLAEKAGVDRRTLQRAKAELLQKASGDADCNKEPPRELTPDELHARNNETEIRAVITAIERCSLDQRVHLAKWIIPLYF